MARGARQVRHQCLTAVPSAAARPDRENPLDERPDRFGRVPLEMDLPFGVCIPKIGCVAAKLKQLWLEGCGFRITMFSCLGLPSQSVCLSFFPVYRVFFGKHAQLATLSGPTYVVQFPKFARYAKPCHHKRDQPAISILFIQNINLVTCQCLQTLLNI